MNLIALPILVPLVTAALLLLLRGSRSRTVLAALSALAVLLADLFIARATLAGEVLVVQMGAWPAPFGITLVADGLSGVMLLLSGITALLTVLLAGSSLWQGARRGQSELLNRARESFGAQALLQFLFMGVNMSVLTGDLFNLFVAFEVMLVASYGLLLLGNETVQLREGLKYVVINLIASAVFVVAAGMVYGLVGSLNMADIAQRVAAHGADGRLTLLVTLLAVVFATKAAVFPLGFWLPNSYPAPPVAVSAFFAAILTKVGLYALIRLFTLMFPQQQELQWVLLALAGVTMLIGGLGAITRQRWQHLFAFGSVASTGYMAMGLFTQSPAGLEAGLYYLVHSVLVIFCLFAVAGLGEKLAGESYRSEGHLSLYPWLGVAYFGAMLALVGLPPTSGFIAKIALVRALLAQGGPLAAFVVAAAVVTSFLLLVAGVKIWQGFFWGESDAVHSLALPRGMVGVTAAATGLLLLLALASGPVYRASQTVAAQLLGNQAYIEQVLPGQAPARLEEAER